MKKVLPFQNCTGSLLRRCASDSWNHFGHTDSCYKVVGREETFGKAEAVCKALNSHLVQIDNVEENKFVAKLLNRETAWIGLSDLSTPGYVWITSGNVPQYTNWAPGEPNNDNDAHCGVMWNSKYPGQWDDENCGKHLLFVCEQGESREGHFIFVCS